MKFMAYGITHRTETMATVRQFCPIANGWIFLRVMERAMAARYCNQENKRLAELYRENLGVELQYREEFP